MSLFNVRHIVSTFLLSVVLFFGVAIINHSPAIADSITRDITNAEMEEQMSDAEYESAKASRQKEQAMRSEKAKAQAELSGDETIEDRLNLDEILPEKVKDIAK